MENEIVIHLPGRTRWPILYNFKKKTMTFRTKPFFFDQQKP